MDRMLDRLSNTLPGSARGRMLRWLLSAAAAASGLYALGLFTFGTSPSGSLQADLRMTLAAAGAFACAAGAARFRAPHDDTGPSRGGALAPVSRSRVLEVEEDLDATLELEPQPGLFLPGSREPAREPVIVDSTATPLPPPPPTTRAGGTPQGPPAYIPPVPAPASAPGTLLVTALLFLAGVATTGWYWLSSDSGAAVASAPAFRADGSLSANDSSADYRVPVADYTRPDLSPATGAPTATDGTTRDATPAQPAAGSALPPDASHARRECMAQVESAHLFLQLARQAENEAAYSLATEPQIQRLLKEKPVGPRTLARIAERMWEQRDAPDRDPSWWSRQYSRCEQARLGGNWYVVRG